MRSPSRVSRSRSTPCVAGCCGPMLSTMSCVARPVAATSTDGPRRRRCPTVRSVLTGPSLPAARAARRSECRPCEPAAASGRVASRRDEPFDPPGEPWVRVSPRLATLRRRAAGRCGCRWCARSRAAWLRRRLAGGRSPPWSALVGLAWAWAVVGRSGAVLGLRRARRRPAGHPRRAAPAAGRRAVRPDAVRRRDRRAAGPPVRAGHRPAAHRRGGHRRAASPAWSRRRRPGCATGWPPAARRSRRACAVSEHSRRARAASAGCTRSPRCCAAGRCSRGRRDRRSSRSYGDVELRLARARHRREHPGRHRLRLRCPGGAPATGSTATTCGSRPACCSAGPAGSASTGCRRSTSSARWSPGTRAGRAAARGGRRLVVRGAARLPVRAGRPAAARRAARPRRGPRTTTTPEAPERVLRQVPLGHLIEAQLRSVGADRRLVSRLVALVVVAVGHRRVAAARPRRARSLLGVVPAVVRTGRRGTSTSRSPSRPTGCGCATACSRPARRPCRPAGSRRCGSSSRCCGGRRAGAGRGQRRRLRRRRAGSARRCCCRSAPRDEALARARPGAARRRRRRRAARPACRAGPAGATRSRGGRLAAGADDRVFVARRGRLPPGDRRRAARAGAERPAHARARCSAGSAWRPCTWTPRRDRSRPPRTTATRTTPGACSTPRSSWRPAGSGRRAARNAGCAHPEPPRRTSERWRA